MSSSTLARRIRPRLQLCQFKHDWPRSGPSTARPFLPGTRSCSAPGPPPAWPARRGWPPVPTAHPQLQHRHEGRTEFRRGVSSQTEGASSRHHGEGSCASHSSCRPSGGKPNHPSTLEHLPCHPPVKSPMKSSSLRPNISTLSSAASWLSKGSRKADLSVAGAAWHATVWRMRPKRLEA